MLLLDRYFGLQLQLNGLQGQAYEYFGYTECHKRFPLEDLRELFWRCDGEMVDFADTKEQLGSGDSWSCPVEGEVYEADDFTMFCIGKQATGIKCLGVFDNSKRIS